MGNHANIYIQDSTDPSDPGVTLYTHWDKDEIAQDLQQVLSRKQRWNHPTCLVRMIFSQMIRGNETSGMGYGIQGGLHQRNEPTIIVDTGKQTVSFVLGSDHPDKEAYTWSFGQFIQLHTDAVDVHWNNAPDWG